MIRREFVDAHDVTIDVVDDGDEPGLLMKFGDLRILVTNPDALLSKITDVLVPPDDDDDDRTCSNCEDTVGYLNTQDECLGCEEQRAGLSQSARKALAELERDGYVYEALRGRYRASGIAPGKNQFSRATIAELSEYVDLVGHSYAAWKKARP